MTLICRRFSIREIFHFHLSSAPKSRSGRHAILARRAEEAFEERNRFWCSTGAFRDTVGAALVRYIALGPLWRIDLGISTLPSLQRSKTSPRLNGWHQKNQTRTLPRSQLIPSRKNPEKQRVAEETVEGKATDDTPTPHQEDLVQMKCCSSLPR